MHRFYCEVSGLGGYSRVLALAAVWMAASFLWCGSGAEVRLGSEVLADRTFGPLRGKRVGLLTNATGVDRHGRSTIDRLRRAADCRLVALFAPEHGLRGEHPAGREFPNGTDATTKLPVYSLYGPGPVRKPTRAMLKGIDVLVYDVQDTGCRSYTYISTMGLAMEACGEAGVEFVVLDRPNPLGGQRVEGAMLNPKFRSFVGRWDIPYLYGMTCGELARMIEGERWITNRCRLTVVPMHGWRRSMVWDDTGLPWVATSPNVPRASTVLHLVATGLLGEIGGVSIGMGTDRPFEYLAAPWIDGARLARILNDYGLPGLRYEPAVITPTRGLYRGKRLSGVRLRLTKPAEAPLVALNFYALEAFKKLAGRDLFADAIKRKQSFTMFDKVNGTDATRKALQAGKTARYLVSNWEPDLEQFRKRRQAYLLYSP